MPGDSYAVVWRESNGPVYAGKVELGPRHLRLEGAASRGRLSIQKLFYDDIVAVRVGRAAHDRIDGRLALVVERRGGRPVRISSVNGLGTLHELAERLDFVRSGMIPA